jgi:hypothetical protein
MPMQCDRLKGQPIAKVKFTSSENLMQCIKASMADSWLVALKALSVF